MPGSPRRRLTADVPSSSSGIGSSNGTTSCSTTTCASIEASDGYENGREFAPSRTAAVSPSKTLKRRKRKGLSRSESVAVRCVEACICVVVCGFGLLLVHLLLHASKGNEADANTSLGRRRDALERDQLGVADSNAAGQDDYQGQRRVADPVATTKFQTTWENMGLGATHGLNPPPQPPPCSPITDLATIQYTLVTQLSEDRVWMLQHHCQRWGYQNPMSLVIYTADSVDAVTSRLVDELHCNPAQLASVQTLSPALFAEGEYPVNLLRNMALMAVRTSHVLYVDVDFWESKHLHSTLMQESIREELANDPKLTIVIPAFQIVRQCRDYRDCREENIAKMPKTHYEMKTMYAKRAAYQFDYTNTNGHGSTMYDVWSLEHGVEDLYEIPCVKSNRYEPYMAFRYCDLLPPFQEQFTGYGKNKMTWIMQMRRVGYSFVQIGEEFLVHYPHLDSKARLEWNKKPDALAILAAKKKALRRGNKVTRLKAMPGDVEEQVDWTAFKRGQVDALYVEFRKWLNQELKDESRVTVCEDAHDDDGKLWVPRDR